MPLHVQVDTVAYTDETEKLFSFYIGRQEDLKSAGTGVHRYALSPVLWPWDSKGEFSHEYSEGANQCTQKALLAFPMHLLPASIPEIPFRIKVDLASYYTVDREILNFYVNKDNFPDVDRHGKQRYGIYHEVWPLEPVAVFDYDANGNLAGCIIKALETIRGE